LEIDNEKIEINRYSIKVKLKIKPLIIAYQSIVPALGLEIDSDKVIDIETFDKKVGANRYSIKEK